MIKPERGWGLLLPALLLAACGGVARVPEDSFYRLDVPLPAERAAAPALDGGLRVQVGAAAPLYRDRALLYSEAGAPERVQRYHYHYWADSPPRLVQRGLTDYLRAAGVAAQVSSPEDGGTARHRLRVDLERFEHLRGADNGRVEVAVYVTVDDAQSGTPRVQERFQASASVHGADFTAIVAAYAQALAELYPRIAQRVIASD